MTTAHIFIGSTPYGQDAEFQMALEYSIRKHASIPVMIYWMVADENPDSPWSGWDRSQWYTPFTGFRWAIPEVAAGMGLDRRSLWTMTLLSSMTLHTYGISHSKTVNC